MDEQYVDGTQVLANNPTLTLTRGTTYSFKLMTLSNSIFVYSLELMTILLLI